MTDRMTFRETIADLISGGALSEASMREDAAKFALRRIIRCETPGANATVKRMARIAREALK